MNNSFFIESKVAILSENIPDRELLDIFKKKILDKDYFDFLEKSKYVSFYFDSSIHIYGYNNLHSYNSIEKINKLYQDEYETIFNGLVSFGQDVFGNQFCFDSLKGGVVLFNVETGERETIADDFLKWLDVLTRDIDYYSGKVLLRKWNSQGNELMPNQRLCPKIPFVMGGEYVTDNLYAGIYPAFVKAYANIARQVYGMKDGTKIRLKID